jgi:hypothetical protein
MIHECELRHFYTFLYILVWSLWFNYGVILIVI